MSLEYDKNPSFWSSGLVSVISNVIGGVIVAVGTAAVIAVWSRIQQCKFRQLFGCTKTEHYYLKYGSFFLPSRSIILSKHPTIVRHDTHPAHNIQDITAEADIRAIGYLAAAFGKGAGIPPVVEGDHIADNIMNISFISIGGLTNHRSRDIARDPANIFLDFQGDKIVAKQTGDILATAPPLTAGYDHGIIVKINPTQSPRRTSIWCAGHGDLGTSGAVWFLANRRPFARITKTTTGSDDSTRLLKELRLRSGKVEVLSKE
jgi:hypothetical protein